MRPDDWSELFGPFAEGFAFELFLDPLEDNSVGSLDEAVGLRVSD